MGCYLTGSPTKEIVDDCINAILSNLTTNSLKVLNCCTAALTAIAQNIARLKYFDQTIIKGIIEKLVGALTEVMMFLNDSTSREVKSLIVSKLFYCLLEWIMIAPRDVLSTHNTAQMICEVLESALLDEHNVKITEPKPAENVEEGHSEIAKTNERSPSKKTSLFDLTRKASLSKLKSSPSMVAMVAEIHRETREAEILHLLGFAHLLNQPLSTAVDEFDITVVEENLIKETAENVLEHILHHVNNFAPPHGSALMSSAIADPVFIDDYSKNNDKYLYFTYNDSTILTLVEIPGSTPQSTRARVIARNVTGKYVWDSFLFCESVKECIQIANNEQFDAKNIIPPVKSLGVVDQLVYREDVHVESAEARLKSVFVFSTDLAESLLLTPETKGKCLNGRPTMELTPSICLISFCNSIFATYVQHW